ncbi:hypothetical protein [[Limnothrix rosea] IAM M-220]|uniref:hypothetical protein n=1 Tax=[Limnothrix rosea] IAM M-220 TaxID=454133 RepID=UPI00095962D5|nr:hypothetical protein [[Limnothrix rosea] IAM M-220]OKH17696.1 hypothetical protein NIES208_08565 [[Limnothrix rosea] IAM M-220]
MPIGEIIWFGGQTQEGKINHYGFISCKGISEKGIYVNRKSLPVDLQKICEQDKDNGQGIVVEFEIEENSRGTQAVDVILNQQIGIINKDLYSPYRSQYIEYIDSSIPYREGYNGDDKDIVSFGIKYLDRPSAVLVDKIEPESIIKDKIKDYAHASNLNFAKHFFDRYTSSLTTEDSIQFILERFKLLPQDQKVGNVFTSKYIDKHVQIIEQALSLDNSHLQQFIWNQLTKLFKDSSENIKEFLWDKIKLLQKKLAYKNELWDLAPLKFKREIIQSRYQKFFSVHEEFVESNYILGVNISERYETLYDFSENDKKLAEIWSNDTSDEFEKAKMLSARGAEKLVKNFYQKLNENNEVIDIAVHQITKKSNEWTKADIVISINGKKQYIDVKNARQTVNSSVYSEFCIPSFKEVRGEDVAIVGVLSPYLQLKYMNQEGASFYVNSPIFLGELIYTQLHNLTKTFKDSVVRLDMTRGFDPKTYLAPWLFDYSAQFYENQIGIAKKLIDLDYKAIPSSDDIALLSTNKSIDTYLSLFIYANKKLPESWAKFIPICKQEFIILLYRKSNTLLKLPEIYMAILKHFLKMLSMNNEEYHPEKIRELIYHGDPYLYHQVNPLKIYDPLNLISDFCKTLGTLWDNRHKTNITGFKIFKFDGRGLLSGKYSEEDPVSTTILAYCGGWIEKKGKCGYSPLIIGKHRNCSSCGKLVCEAEGCGFCSLNCSAYLERQQLIYERKLNKYSSRSFGY